MRRPMNYIGNTAESLEVMGKRKRGRPKLQWGHKVRANMKKYKLDKRDSMNNKKWREILKDTTRKEPLDFQAIGFYDEDSISPAVLKADSDGTLVAGGAKNLRASVDKVGNFTALTLQYSSGFTGDIILISSMLFEFSK
ncbi:unnamed protein product [Gordionus sp. m RMFG-2023]